jgi:hypothetical protein
MATPLSDTWYASMDRSSPSAERALSRHSGLIALINQKLGHRAGFVNPLLYASPSAFCSDHDALRERQQIRMIKPSEQATP